MSRQAEYRSRRLAEGYKQVNLLLDPETVKALDALRKDYGSNAETVREAVRLLFEKSRD